MTEPINRFPSTSADWDSYADIQLEMFEPGINGMTKDPKVAVKSIELLKEQIPTRLSKLQTLVDPLNIKIDGSDQSLEDLNDFLLHNISLQPGTDHMAFGWGEFCADMGVYIGEIICQRYTGYWWDVLSQHPGDHNYLEIGVKHNPDVHNVRYFINPFGVTYNAAKIFLRSNPRFTKSNMTAFKMVVVQVAVITVDPHEEQAQLFYPYGCLKFYNENGLNNGEVWAR